MDVTAEAGAAGAQSSQAEPAEPKQGNVEKGEALFPLKNDTIVTFTHGFSASSRQDSYSGWIRHPLATNGWYWNIRVKVYGEAHVKFWWTYMPRDEDADAVAPCFPRAFSYVISKENQGILAKGQIPWFAEIGDSYKWVQLSKYIPFTPPADKTFFVSVTLSVLTDQEIVAALRVWSIPRAPEAFSTKCKCASQDQTIAKRLWESRKGADLVVETADGKDIQAHKCMLIENSPVFEAMFAHDTLEKTSGRLKLNDLSHDVVYEMIQFFYLDCVSSQNINVLRDLVKVADRYDVPRLKNACEILLLEQLYMQPRLGWYCLRFSNLYNLKNLKKHSELALLTVHFKNYVKILSLAIDNSAELLWRYAAAMLFLFRCNVMEDVCWKKFEVAHPQVARTLLTEYMHMDREGSGRMCAIVHQKKAVSTSGDTGISDSEGSDT